VLHQDFLSSCIGALHKLLHLYKQNAVHVSLGLSLCRTSYNEVCMSVWVYVDVPRHTMKLAQNIAAWVSMTTWGNSRPNIANPTSSKQHSRLSYPHLPKQTSHDSDTERRDHGRLLTSCSTTARVSDDRLRPLSSYAIEVGPSTELMPYLVTIARASFVACHSQPRGSHITEACLLTHTTACGNCISSARTSLR
jgi:hypothetical protein